MGSEPIAETIAEEERNTLLTIFLKYRAQLMCYIARLSGSPDLAEDVAQEAYLKLLARGPGPIRSPRNLLFLVARRLVIDHKRRLQVAATDYVPDVEAIRPLTGSPNPEAAVLAREELRLLCAALDDLPTQQRRAFVLRKVHGLSHREIAEDMGITVSTVQKHLAKGIREVSRCLDPALDAQKGSAQADAARMRSMGKTDA